MARRALTRPVKWVNSGTRRQNMAFVPPTKNLILKTQFFRSVPLLVAACLSTAISSPPARAATVVVTLSGNNLFSPKDVTINAGDSITFTNRAGFHNAVCQDPDPTCGFKTAQSAPWGATTTFNTAGLFRYRCTVHSGNFTSGRACPKSRHFWEVAIYDGFQWAYNSG